MVQIINYWLLINVSKLVAFPKLPFTDCFCEILFQCKSIKKNIKQHKNCDYPVLALFSVTRKSLWTDKHTNLRLSPAQFKKKLIRIPEILFWQCGLNTLLKEMKIIHNQSCNFILFVPVCLAQKYFSTSFLHPSCPRISLVQHYISSEFMEKFGRWNSPLTCGAVEDFINDRNLFLLLLVFQLVPPNPNSFQPYKEPQTLNAPIPDITLRTVAE